MQEETNKFKSHYQRVEIWGEFQHNGLTAVLGGFVGVSLSMLQ